MRESVRTTVGGSPVQQLPVLAAPLVPELLRVHAPDAVKVRFVDPEQAKAVYLPVAWGAGGPFRPWSREASPSPDGAAPSAGGSQGHPSVWVPPWEPCTGLCTGGGPQQLGMTLGPPGRTWVLWGGRFLDATGH